MTVVAEPTRPWSLYLLECQRGQLYAGISPDPERRYAAHLAGRGARYTRANPPVRMLAVCAYASRSAASVAEHWLKSQTRTAKLAWAAAHTYIAAVPSECAAHSVAVISRSSSASRKVPRPA